MGQDSLNGRLALLTSILAAVMLRLGLTEEVLGSIRCWASDISSLECPDLNVGLEWFNPLQDANVVGTFHHGWYHEIRGHDGDGDDVSDPYYQIASDEYSTMTGCMYSFVDDFVLYAREENKKYMEGLSRQSEL